MNGAVKMSVNPVESLDPETGDVQLNQGLTEKAEISSATGLCKTCDNLGLCEFNRPGKVLLHCQELDYPPRQAEPDAEERLSLAAARPPVLQTGANSGGFLGLCSTCEIREGCTFTKPEGGVWNCEEFV